MGHRDRLSSTVQCLARGAGCRRAVASHCDSTHGHAQGFV